MVMLFLSTPVLSWCPPCSELSLTNGGGKEKSSNLASISNEFFSHNYLIRADRTAGSVYDPLAGLEPC